MPPPHTYVCAKCGGQFVAERDDEAQAESVALWGRRGDTGGMAELCDDCWRAFMAWYAREKGN